MIKKITYCLLTMIIISCSRSIPDGIYSFEDRSASVYVFHGSEFIRMYRFDLFQSEGRGNYKIKNRRFYFFYDSVSYKNVEQDSMLHFIVFNPSILLIDGDTHIVRGRKFVKHMVRLDSLPPGFHEGEVEFLKSDRIYNRKFDW